MGADGTISVTANVAPARVAEELHDELIVPFVFRRYLDFGVFESLREMHHMISAEVEKREMAANVKLGPGGIRDGEAVHDPRPWE